jgi:hypothetical protein
MNLLWHKIVLQRDVGKTDLHRPTYSHFLCYSKHGKPGVAFPDVIPVSKKLYPNGAPTAGAQCAADYLAKQVRQSSQTQTHQSSQTPQVVDPFVGRGTFGLACVNNGLSFLGLDIDEAQCEKTRQLLKANLGL